MKTSNKLFRINTDNGELELQIEVAGWGATNKVIVYYRGRQNKVEYSRI